MHKEEFEQEPHDEQAKTYDDSEDDDADPKESAFMKGYEEADDIVFANTEGYALLYEVPI